MAKSNSERQSAYRRKNECEYRINVIMHHEYRWKVKVIAERYAVTKKGVMEKAIDAMFDDAIEFMTEDEKEVLFNKVNQ